MKLEEFCTLAEEGKQQKNLNRSTNDVQAKMTMNFRS